MGEDIEPVQHDDFLITKYLKSLEGHGIHPIVASMLFGTIVMTAVILGSIFFQSYPSIGYLSALGWLFIGPYLILVAERMIDDLWPELIGLIDKKRVKELQKLERRFHGRRYLLVGLPAVGVIAAWVLYDYSASWFYLPVWFGSWTIWALLGSIGFWGVFQLVSLMVHIGRSDLNLNPMSPDRLGGLGLLADFSIKGTMLFSTGALMMIPMVYELISETRAANTVVYLTYTVTGAFSLVVLLSFLIPLFSLNKAAKRTRERIVEDAADRFQEAREEYQMHPERIEIGIRLLVLMQEFNENEKMSVWPWDVDVILKLGGSVLLPILVSFFRTTILPMLLLAIMM